MECIYFDGQNMGRVKKLKDHIEWHINRHITNRYDWGEVVTDSIDIVMKKITITSKLFVNMQYLSAVEIDWKRCMEWMSL